VATVPTASCLLTVPRTPYKVDSAYAVRGDEVVAVGAGIWPPLPCRRSLTFASRGGLFFFFFLGQKLDRERKTYYAVAAAGQRKSVARVVAADVPCFEAVIEDGEVLRSVEPEEHNVCRTCHHSERMRNVQYAITYS
jgi:hypothetical protein